MMICKVVDTHQERSNNMVDTVNILGSLLANGNLSSGSGESLLKTILGAVAGGSQSKGGLGDMLGSMLGGASSDSRGQSGGGLGSLLGSILGGTQSPQQSGGSLGDLLGGVLGSGSGSNTRGSGGGADLGSLIGAALSQFANKEQAAQTHTQPRSFEELSPEMGHDEACEQATLMIRAMVNAAKADGRVDKQEQEKILGKLGNVSQDEIRFLRNELEKPLDVDGFVRSIPAGAANQIYAMSLMAIDLDSNPEAQYLHQLAQGLNIAPQVANQIHTQLGAPKLYS
jgi:uncharacterized membrane protein YebE (DUF533 family)